MAGITKAVLVQYLKRDQNPCWKCPDLIPAGTPFVKTYGPPGEISGKVMRFHIPCFRALWTEEKVAFDKLLDEIEVEAMVGASPEAKTLDVYTTLNDPDSEDK